MADKEQVERLKRSVEEWNTWREKHSEIRPDLSRSDLSEVSLYRANLSRVDLSGADLSFAYLKEIDFGDSNLSGAELSNAWLDGANLRDANFTKADFRNASLIGADLSAFLIKATYLNRTFRRTGKITGVFKPSEVRFVLPVFHPSRVNFSGADLSCADFRNANLIEADFRDADLSETNFSGADLRNACLDRAQLYQTIFAENDLSTVEGLDTVTHEGPSFVDIKTVALPQGEVLRFFLRGTGFPNALIDHLPSLLNTSTQYVSCFISYAHQDKALAERLYQHLQSKGVRCWMAPHDLRPGNYYRERIDQAIHSQDKLLLLLSEHSVKSGWVRYEVEQVLARENQQQKEILFPLRLDNAIFDCTASWALSLRSTRHIGDFTGWQDEVFYQQAFTTLLQHLKVTKPPIP